MNHFVTVLVTESLLDPRWSLPVLLELVPQPEEHMLVEKVAPPGTPWAEAPVRHAPITPELYFLLQAAECPTARPLLEAKARELGAEPGEAEDVVQNLIDENLLVPAGLLPNT